MGIVNLTVHKNTIEKRRKKKMHTAVQSFLKANNHIDGILILTATKTPDDCIEYSGMFNAVTPELAAVMKSKVNLDVVQEV